MKKILLASVIYPTPLLETFIRDLLSSIKSQTFTNFEILLFLDGIKEKSISNIVKSFDLRQKINYIMSEINTLSPSCIRREILNFAYSQNFDILMFCDFDEAITKERVEFTLSFMQKHNADFSYCNAYVTNKDLIPLENGNLTFFSNKEIPKCINSIYPILKKNFIGLGGLTLNLKKRLTYNLENQHNILAFDWFLATLMLLDHWKGFKIEKCLVFYRQHEQNYIGTNSMLNEKTLNLGILVKKMHYTYFSKKNHIFLPLLQQIIETEKYIAKNKDKYIRIINTNFNNKRLHWWENIKTLEEIKQWI